MGKQIDGFLQRIMRGFTGTSYQVPRLDSSSFATEVISYEHHEIHGGSHYFIGDVADLAINNVFDVQWTTPNTTQWAHFTFELGCENETEWYIYEGATINTAGTALTARNNDRNSANTSNATIASIENISVANANADTAVAGATQIIHGICGSGRSGGVDSRQKEIILKQNTIYCMRAIANAAGYINFMMEWYEHQNKE